MAGLTRRNEGGLSDFRREMDRLFEDFFSPGFGRGASGMQQFVPSVDIAESDDGYVLRAELPGIDPEQVQLNVDNNVLTLSGEKGWEKSGKGRGGYEYRESSYGSFTRSIQLPQGTDASKIRADMKNGVLEVQIPKSEAARPRRIPLGGAQAQQGQPLQGGGGGAQAQQGQQGGRNIQPNVKH